MKLARTLATVGLATLPLMTSGCLTTSSQYADIEIAADADPKFNFEAYETYAWAAAVAAVNDPDGTWTEPELDVGAEIVFLTNREMRKRGMSEVAESPDVLLMYAVGVDMKALDVVTTSEDGTEHLEEVPQGAVAILMVDPASRRAMWVGTASANLAEDPSMEETKERLDYAITHIFKKYGK